MANDKMLLSLGSCQSSSPFGAHGSGSSSTLRHRHLGCWRNHSCEVAGASGDLSASAAVNNMLTLDLYEHESGFGG